MSARKDLIGKRFGRLIVISDTGDNAKSRHAIWLCKCDCGNETRVTSHGLSSGRTRSCGCLALESLRLKAKPAALKARVSHGETIKGATTSSEYTTWTGIKARTNNPKNNSWKYYGGRGIKICGRWAKNYEAFLEDMGRKPGPEYSLDRIDNDGDYEPSNCRWATRKEQRANQRKMVFESEMYEAFNLGFRIGLGEKINV